MEGRGCGGADVGGGVGGEVRRCLGVGVGGGRVFGTGLCLEEGAVCAGLECTCSYVSRGA